MAGAGVEGVHDALVLDPYGVLHRGARWVALSPVQESLMTTLLARMGQPVGRAEMIEGTWPGGEPRRALDTHMAKLRTRIRPLGLTIHTIWGRGFLLAS